MKIIQKLNFCGGRAEGKQTEYDSQYILIFPPKEFDMNMFKINVDCVKEHCDIFLSTNVKKIVSLFTRNTCRIFMRKKAQ